MILVKYIGSIAILLIVFVYYMFKMKKDDRRKNRYIIFTSIGFGFMALPSWFITNKNVLMVCSVLAIVLVIIGLLLYIQMRKSLNIEKDDKKMYRTKKDM
ncbi:RsiW-degrading membrane proteinase PrsW (M82 family) [Paenibacillus sp. 1182]|uniref:hypothetical protein n=1 Tax=Paenibacillus sp. 1182 TaxID=2806565 RepID=UPI001AE3E9D2|nr:hypothetical protein [Paenibacillus sp. 1182]MBP1308758.1 RsiW-degrading membrane proteinase PrsW (M82 family) [Paenibacillus sp. 1182]